MGLVGNCADVIPELVRRGAVPDMLTDQTSAHDELNGYIPNGMTLDEARALRCSNPEEYVRRSIEAMGEHVRAMLALKRMGAVTFDYGNNIRAQAKKAGVDDAFDIPGFVPEYIRPLFCEGRGPFRWAALSGDPEDIRTTDRLALELFPKNETLKRWMKLASERIHFQGLPARICWLGYGERAEFGLAMNESDPQGHDRRAGGDRAGSSGYGFRGVAVSRNGSDAGWIGCDRGLAAVERDGERGGGRIVGFDSQRRRSGHRVCAACGDGGGGGRNRRLRAAAGTGADHRSRHRRDSPCGRGIRAREGSGARTGHSHSRWTNEHPRGRRVFGTGHDGWSGAASRWRRSCENWASFAMARC